jgi:hypothetical protein
VEPGLPAVTKSRSQTNLNHSIKIEHDLDFKPGKPCYSSKPYDLNRTIWIA